ncbi:hypothetical protein Tco_0136640, partial [Tanacetum coccineum]
EVDLIGFFDIDALTKSMNYKPVVTGNQSNGNAGTKAFDDADLKSSPDAGLKPSGDNEKMVFEEPGKEGGDSSNDQEKDDNINSTNNINTASDGNNTNNVNAVSSTVDAARIEVNVVDPKSSIELPDDPNMHELEDIVYSDDDEDVGCNTPKLGRSGIWVRGVLLHRSITQDIYRTTKKSFENDTLDLTK